MPLYRYCCEECGAEREQLRAVDDRARSSECDDCGGTMQFNPIPGQICISRDRTISAPKCGECEWSSTQVDSGFVGFKISGNDVELTNCVAQNAHIGITIDRGVSGTSIKGFETRNVANSIHID